MGVPFLYRRWDQIIFVAAKDCVFCDPMSGCETGRIDAPLELAKVEGGEPVFEWRDDGQRI